jgi:hypothetical protein
MLEASHWRRKTVLLVFQLAPVYAGSDYLRHHDAGLMAMALIVCTTRRRQYPFFLDTSDRKSCATAWRWAQTII